MAVPAGIIVGWPSTDGSIPTGWSRVESLDSYYTRGVASIETSPGSVGGSATHSHSTPGHTHNLSHSHASKASNVAAGSSLGESGFLPLSAPSHYHTFSAPTNSSVATPTSAPDSDLNSNDPANLTVIWIESEGTENNIPSGALAFWDDSTLPGGWSLYEDAKNRFLKGAGIGGDGGATQASQIASHTHTVISHTHAGATHGHSNSTSSTYVGNGDDAGQSRNDPAVSFAISTHTHTVSFGSASTGNTSSDSGGTSGSSNGNEPPFYKLGIIESPSGLPTGIIALWLGSLGNIPSGWEICDGNNGTPNLLNKFVKGANDTGEIGTEGGSTDTHTHTAPSNHNHTLSSHTHTASFSSVSTSGGLFGTKQGTDANHGAEHATNTAAATPTVGNASVGELEEAQTIPLFTTVSYIQFTEAPSTFDIDVEEGQIIVSVVDTLEVFTILLTEDVQETLQISISWQDENSPKIVPKPFYPTQIKIEYLNSSSVWTDISQYVVGDIQVEGSNLISNRVNDRLGTSGEAKLLLDNSSQVFIPNTTTTLDGWKKSTPVRIIVTVDAEDRIQFVGRIEEVQLARRKEDIYAKVVLVDWLTHASRFPLELIPTFDEVDIKSAVEQIIALMSITPENTELSTGLDTFPTAFDTVTDKTTATSELNKLVLSELGYIYMNYIGGETLVVESRSSRKGSNVPRLITANSELITLITYED